MRDDGWQQMDGKAHVRYESRADVGGEIQPRSKNCVTASSKIEQLTQLTFPAICPQI